MNRHCGTSIAPPAFSGFEFRIEEVSLHELTYIEEGTFKPGLCGLYYGKLLLEMRDGRARIYNSLLCVALGDGQALQVVFNSIALVSNVLPALRLLVVARKVGNTIRKKLAQQRRNLRVPTLIFLLERRQFLQK